MKFQNPAVTVKQKECEESSSVFINGEICLLVKLKEIKWLLSTRRDNGVIFIKLDGTSFDEGSKECKGAKNNELEILVKFSLKQRIGLFCAQKAGMAWK